MDRSPPDRRRWRGRVGATALSAGLHVTLLVVLLVGWRTVARPTPQLEVPVSLAPAPPPAPSAPQPAAPAKAAAVRKAVAKQPAAHPTPPPVAVVARRSPAPPAATSPAEARVASRAPRASLDQLVDAQLEANGGATGGAGQGVGEAGQGAGGGADCDMAARVQRALRKDPLARAAVHAAGSGRSILIWNGDWVQAGAEDGKGLAAVREAITWEVAFAPAACRHQRVRGPVLLSLNDGSPQVELDAGEWRWSDLLGLR
jgi:hypothetical protein